MTAPALRRGFTLTELLVVLFILAILLGLLLAAVQHVRHRAARLACGNNLRQLALALHHYHDIHQAFPPGVAHPVIGAVGIDPGAPADPFPLLNWPARLLPFFEQDGLWREVQATYARDPGLRFIPPPAYAQLSIFSCPADSVRSPRRPDHRLLGPLSYPGVAGVDSLFNDGILFTDSRVRLADILDGSSNTLLLGERPPSRYVDHGRYFGGWGNWGPADAYLGVREIWVSISAGCYPLPAPFQASHLADPCSPYHFWSFHPGGAGFAFADGSVRFLPYSADSLLPALSTRAGGEAPAALPGG